MAVHTLKDNLYLTEELIDKKPSFLLGFPEMDKLTGPADGTDSMIVIAARPGTGKTTIACSIARMKLDQGLTVGYYSGEMKASTIMKKIYPDLEFNVLAHRDKKLYVLDSEDGFATTAVLEQFINEQKLDILIVDQFSLLSSSSNATDYRADELLAQHLRQVQSRTKIPIIVLSQLSRVAAKVDDKDKEDSGFLLSTLAKSDAVGAFASRVYILLREKPYTRLTCVKNRENGQLGSKLLEHINGEYFEVDTSVDLNGLPF